MPNAFSSSEPNSTQAPPRDWVFVSLEAWDEVWRRNQFLVAGFVEEKMTRRLLWVEPPHNLSLWALRCLKGKRRPFPRSRLQKIKGVAGVWRFAPMQPLPNTFAPFRALNERVERFQTRRASQRLGLKRPLLWINNHWAAPLAGHLDESALIYDITDDWLVWETAPRRRERLQKFDSLLCGRANATIVCSAQLFERRRAVAPHLHLVPNGVDAAHYQGVGDIAPAPLAASWKSPVLGYLGTIHPDRVDVGLVEFLAREWPGASVALVGPVMLQPDELARLRAFPNIVLTGPVPYEQVPSFLTRFDVALVPHVESEFTQSLNPIKLGEYLAAGLPVVSTRVAGFVEVAETRPDLVRAVSGREAFLAACRAGVSEGNPSQKRDARRALARDMSWRARVEQIKTIVEGFGE